MIQHFTGKYILYRQNQGVCRFQISATLQLFKPYNGLHESILSGLNILRHFITPSKQQKSANSTYKLGTFHL
jgi:hypothetical protein